MRIRRRGAVKSWKVVSDPAAWRRRGPHAGPRRQVGFSRPAAVLRRMRSTPRLLFIDNIRWTMIVLVLSVHACDTYSPFGNWYYVDRQPAGLGTKLFFGAYQSFLQAFFMALLFFIAGYFSVAAYDRKGLLPFVRDRFFRLGLPTLLYTFVIGPLTQCYLSRTWGTGGFRRHMVLRLPLGA